MPDARDLLIGFYGDDFTGSTDAMESLAAGGLRTVLFVNPPSAEQIARYEGLRAVGVAGLTRSLPADEMAAALAPALEALRNLGAPLVHYKVCSTFDSSPAIGSIGRAIDVGAEVFASAYVPVLGGAPSLGRHCVFGNLFARSGADSNPFRLDRHPSMSRHPITPMDEADLTRHLARQTAKTIALFDITHLAEPADAAKRHFDALLAGGAEVVLIDLLYDSQHAAVGRLLAPRGSREKPLFVVGPSGVEAALTAHWREQGAIPRTATFADPGSARPRLVVSGTCSVVTAGQIAWALGQGFAEVAVDSAAIARGAGSDPAEQQAAGEAAKLLQAGKNVIVHTGRGPEDPRIAAVTDALRAGGYDDLAIKTRSGAVFGKALGRVLRSILQAAPVKRVIVAGGDTAGNLAREVGVESLEMVAPLTPGSPLCKVRAPGSPADGLEITFKGGQIGKTDFFGAVADGKAD